MSSPRPPRPTDARASREPWTVRVAMWSARHRWLVFALGSSRRSACSWCSPKLGGIRTLDVNGDPTRATTRVRAGLRRLRRRRATAPSERLVIVIDGGPGAATDPAFQAGVAALVADLTAAHATVDGTDPPTFDQVVDPFVVAAAQAGPHLADGSTVQVVGNIPGERDRSSAEAGACPRDRRRGARRPCPARTIHVISSTFINRDINDLIASDLDGSLRLTIPLTFMILLLAFGAIVASLVPLVLAMTSLARRVTGSSACTARRSGRSARTRPS